MTETDRIFLMGVIAGAAVSLGAVELADSLLVGSLGYIGAIGFGAIYWRDHREVNDG